MAEDTSSGTVYYRMFQSQIDPNGPEYITHLILQSIREERMKNPDYIKALGSQMRECFTKAGLSYQGQEAMRIHAGIFHEVFIEETSTVSDADRHFWFSTEDYFTLLRGEELGWRSFLMGMLPYLRLNKAVGFLEKLLGHCNIQQETENDLTDLRLLMCAITLSHSTVLDFWIANCKDIQNPVSKDDEKCAPSKHAQLEMNMENFSRHMTTCLGLLIQLSNASHLSNAVVKNSSIFRQLVECLAFSSVILSPYNTPHETSELLQRLYIGRKCVPEVDEKGDKKRIVKRSEKWRERCKLDDEFEMSEVLLPHSHESLVNTNPETGGSSPTDSLEKAEEKMDPFTCLFVHMKSHTTPELYFSLTQFFSRGDFKNNESFYNALISVLVEENNLHFGHHILSGHEFHSTFIKSLQTILNGSSQSGDNLKNTEQLTSLLKEGNIELPEELSNLERLKMTEVKLILESGRNLFGKDDLDLVKRVSENKEKGWRELLSMGLKTTDIDGWWKAGFFELVRQNEAALSSEDNIIQILRILYTAARDSASSSDTQDMVENLKQLFNAMFRRLPTLLQEHVVLSTMSAPFPGKRHVRGSPAQEESFLKAGKDFPGLISQEEIVGELIPLLNRLTMDNVTELMTQVLQLCLFDMETVLCQAVQVAMENKGQIGPIVEVFRQMPNICGLQVDKGTKTKLVQCMLEVLEGTDLTESKANNIIQLFSFLAEKSIPGTDPVTQSSQEIKSLVPPVRIFLHFVLPSLNCRDDQHGDEQTNEGEEKKCPGLQENMEQMIKSERSPSRNLAGDIHSEKTSDSREEGGDGNPVLPLHVALVTMYSATEEMNGSELMALMPFPLLVTMADIYAGNYCVFVDGELDRMRVAVKMAAHKNIGLLTAAILKHSKQIPESHFYWLKQLVLKRGWLHIAILKPALNIGCDVELHDVLGPLTRQIKTAETESQKLPGLVLLFQLALVNDDMFSDVAYSIQQAKATASPSSLVTVLAHILMVSVTTEMERLVDTILTFLAYSDQPVIVSNQPARTDQSSSVGSFSVQASQLLCDAALVLSSGEMAELSRCYIVSNYQAASQSLMSERGKDLRLLSTLFCHHCVLLSNVDGEAAQILQVSAVDVLSKLSVLVTCGKDNKRSTGVSRPEKKQWQTLIPSLRSHVLCVKDNVVEDVLQNQLKKIC